MTDVSTTEHSDGVVVASIDRPTKANALRRETIVDIRSAVEHAQRRDSRAVVLVGSAGRFSAGADLEELSGTIDDLGFDEELELLTTAIASSPLVVLAALEGCCFGAAVDLAWSCDGVVVAADTRIAIPATRVGLLYNPHSLARLYARLGPSLARRLLVIGEEVSGATLGASGAALTVEPGAALETAVTVAQGVGVAEATAATKAALAALDSGSFDPSAWQQEREDLLSSPGRFIALRARKADVKGPT